LGSEQDGTIPYGIDFIGISKVPKKFCHFSCYPHRQISCLKKTSELDMQYLALQRQTRSGAPYVYPIVKTKNRKFGPLIRQEVISRKTPTLITGAHDSGKTRMLAKLHAAERDIWGKKIDAPALWLSALRPLGAWTDTPHLGEWWTARNQKRAADGEASDKLRPWGRLAAWERVEALPLYLRDTGAVLFVDDAHKLAGRKLQIARECVLAAGVWCAAAAEESRIPPNLRNVMLRTDPQVIRLGSDVAYDATSIMTWLLVLLLVASGAWQAGMMVAGLRAIATGRRAARQDA
jgi:hypothetical protein